MGNINVLLDSVLNESLIDEKAAEEEAQKRGMSAPDPEKFGAKRTPKEYITNKAKEAKDSLDALGKKYDGAKEALEKNYGEHKDMYKYGSVGLAALGAGLGAVALARKLRQKKAAVKK